MADVKKAISLQISYISEHGDDMAIRLAQACASWHPQQKASVPALLSVYIADEVFEDFPEID